MMWRYSLLSLWPESSDLWPRLSEMTYTVPSGTLNPSIRILTIPYHTWPLTSIFETISPTYLDYCLENWKSWILILWWWLSATSLNGIIPPKRFWPFNLDLVDWSLDYVELFHKIYNHNHNHNHKKQYVTWQSQWIKHWIGGDLIKSFFSNPVNRHTDRQKLKHNLFGGGS